MYVGRDMTELTMMSKQDWTSKELEFFHQNLQQIVPYLNSEGITIQREIIKEIISRRKFDDDEASYEHGTREHYD